MKTKLTIIVIAAAAFQKRHPAPRLDRFGDVDDDDDDSDDYGINDGNDDDVGVSCKNQIDKDKSFMSS